MYRFLFLLTLALSHLSLYATEDEEIIIIGSYIESKDREASPVDLVDRDSFLTTRVTTLGQINKYLTVSSGSHFQSNTLDGVDQGMSSITLRGLDHASTLLLINTLRQTHSGTPSHEGEGYVDTNIIPEIAIEQIEILKEGATSLYGSDAVAGVVNIRTRKGIIGNNIKLDINKTSNYSQRDIVFGYLGGKNVLGGNLTFGVNLLDKTPLNASEIPRIAELGISTLGNTFKLLDDADVNSGPYAGSYKAGEWVKDINCLDNGGLIQGPFCKFQYGNRFNIVNDEEHVKAYLNFEKDFETITYDLTAMISQVDVNDNPQSPSYPALSFLSKEVGINEGGNPFGVPIIWYGRPLGSAFPSPNSPKDIFQYHIAETISFILGEYQIESSVAFSGHTNKHSRPDIVDSRFQTAITGQGGKDGKSTWNIFEPTSNPLELINFLKGSEDSSKQASLTSLNFIVKRGYEDLDIVFGAQLNWEDLNIKYNDLSRVEFDKDGKQLNQSDLLFLGGGKNVSTSRDKQALFFELNKYFNNSELRFSARHERLVNASSTDPKISFRHAFNDSLIFRASKGSSFTAPSMAQMYSSDIQLGSVRDINGSPFVRLAQLGNPNLKPATSDNQNFGFLLDLTENLKVTLDWWEIDYKNRVEAESAQALIADDPYSPSVTRNIFGDLIGVSTTYFNEEITEVSGLDYHIEFSTQMHLGEFIFKIEGTQLSEFLTPNDNDEGHDDEGHQHKDLINRVGKFNFDAHTHSLPKNRINLFMNFQVGSYDFGLISRFVSGYSNYRDISPLALSLGYKDKVRDFLVHDLSISKSVAFVNGHLDLVFSIENFLDQAAPLLYDEPDFSFDTRVHDPRGRILKFSLDYNW
ncbi:MAG: TonB-dependent receptor [Gammaproteobacteria bacterium]